MNSANSIGYSQAESYFVSESQRVHFTLKVHVEDKPDAIFWRKVLTPFRANADIEFIYEHNNISSKKNEGKGASAGKCNILRAVERGMLGLSQNEIVCVDADYDELIQDDFTKIISSNPYIYTTHWHSIENIILADSNLENLYYDLTCSDFDKTIVQDRDQILDTIAPLFELYLFIRQMPSERDMYSLEMLQEDIKKITEGSGLQDVKDERHNLWDAYASGVADMADMLQSKGYSHVDYAKLIQGHTLWHNVLKQIVVSKLRNALPDNPSLENEIDCFRKFGYNVDGIDVIEKIRDRIKKDFFSNLNIVTNENSLRL